MATESPSLIARFAERMGVDPAKMLTTLKATAFRQRDNSDITNEQMMALLIVADQYGLNPFIKELYAYNDRGAIIPVVSVDGWVRLVNSNRDYDGLEFRYSDEMPKLACGKPCPEWCEVSIYRKSLGRPVVVREYIDEVYVQSRGGKPTPWQSHPKRMLRHKAFIQSARVAFGFAGIYDEDEAYRIIDGESSRATSTAGGANTQQLQAALEQRAQATNVIEHEANPLNALKGTEASVLVIDEPDGDDTNHDKEAQAEVVLDGRATDAALVYDSEGPAGLEAMIRDADSQQKIDELVDVISKIGDEGVRKELTRALLLRKSALLDLT